MSVDTSRQVVERLAARIDTWRVPAIRGRDPRWDNVTATLRALLAEREALIADNARLLDSVTQESEARAAAEAEREACRRAGVLEGLELAFSIAGNLALSFDQDGDDDGVDAANIVADRIANRIRALTPPEDGP